MDPTLAFLLGFFVGMSTFVAYGYYALYKLRKTKSEVMDKIRKTIKETADGIDSKRESIMARLREAQEITQQQLDIRDAADMPSKNALHSKYKNGLNGDMRELETRKLAILQSILDDGIDPVITVTNESGVNEQHPLSHFINKAKADHPDLFEEEAAPKKNTGRFVVLKGGKDDGTTH